MTAHRPIRREAGFALVLVLVGVALLAFILEIVLLISTRAVQTVSADVMRSQLECAAQAGITEGLVSLVNQNPEPQWRLDGTSQTIIFNGFPVAVNIASEAGKVNINQASLSLMTNLFAAAGLDQTDAQTMADRVLDWREPGRFKRLNGAKTADYHSAGSPYEPRLGPFQSIDELNLVLGMTPSLYARVAPGVTIYSVIPLPDPQSAPPLVLQALGLSTATVEAIMADRASGKVAPNNGLNQMNTTETIPGLPALAFTITATAGSAGEVVIRSETIRFTGNPKDPFWILALY